MMPVLNEENYEFDFLYFDYYIQRNNTRTRVYHRLDLEFHIQKKLPRVIEPGL